MFCSSFKPVMFGGLIQRFSMDSTKALQISRQHTSTTCSVMILTLVRSVEYLHGLTVSFGEESL
jgi:hypothetical protein